MSRAKTSVVVHFQVLTSKQEHWCHFRETANRHAKIVGTGNRAVPVIHKMLRPYSKCQAALRQTVPGLSWLPIWYEDLASRRLNISETHIRTTRMSKHHLANCFQTGVN